MADLATEARGPLLKAFSQQQSAISRINNAYQANRTELAALNAAMKDAGLNTTGAMISVSDTGIVISNGKGATITMAGPAVDINLGALTIV